MQRSVIYRSACTLTRSAFHAQHHCFCLLLDAVCGAQEHCASSAQRCLPALLCLQSSRALGGQLQDGHAFAILDLISASQAVESSLATCSRRFAAEVAGAKKLLKKCKWWKRARGFTQSTKISSSVDAHEICRMHQHCKQSPVQVSAFGRSTPRKHVAYCTCRECVRVLCGDIETAVEMSSRQLWLLPTLALARLHELKAQVQILAAGFCSSMLHS